MLDEGEDITGDVRVGGLVWAAHRRCARNDD